MDPSSTSTDPVLDSARDSDLDSPPPNEDFDPGIPLANDGWELFAYHYCNHTNKTRAYIEAGYSTNGAGQGGARLYNNPQVRARIEFLMAERRERLSLSADKVLEEIAILSHSNLNDYEYIGDGKFKVNRPLDPKLSRAIGRIRFEKKTYFDKELGEMVTVDRAELGLWDKPSILKINAAHHGIDKVNVNIIDPKKAIAEALGINEEDIPE